ncbi:MAG: glycine cleavage system aminomethyltransferase GcvT [Solobacterium sp.]|nr:glycine cleavage system aminomethyltransferase GcvT [Solobacterium sp.]
MEKKTVLYDCHTALNARIVPFAGFLMPVQYTDILEEHMAVREKAGLFDVSHMGEIMLEGEDAVKNLNHLLTNDYTVMKTGKVRYSPMCYENGGVVDDLLVYKMGETKYLIVVNASNKDKDYEWMKQNISGNVTLKDISDEVAQVALQGPLSDRVMEKLTDLDTLPKKYYSFMENVDVGGICCLVSQTGYTGEFGYEIYCPAEKGVQLWNILMEAGKEIGLLPCGLGARDTLRLEAAMPLYGHEMDETITPLETGLGFAVKMGKEEFIGKKAMEEKGEPGITRVGLKVTGRGIVREHMDVLKDGNKVGHTTSGTFLPYLKGAYAMALIDKSFAETGTPLTVLVRGRETACEVTELPFYKRGE